MGGSTYAFVGRYFQRYRSNETDLPCKEYRNAVHSFPPCSWSEMYIGVPALKILPLIVLLMHSSANLNKMEKVYIHFSPLNTPSPMGGQSTSTLPTLSTSAYIVSEVNNSFED